MGGIKTHTVTALSIGVTRRRILVRFYQTVSLVPQLGKLKCEVAFDSLMAEIGRVFAGCARQDRLCSLQGRWSAPAVSGHFRFMRAKERRAHG